jgi:hypothetical protein
VSIDRRLIISDNLGACPCIEPLALGRVMEAICNGHRPTLRARVVKALAQLRKRLAR